MGSRLSDLYKKIFGRSDNTPERAGPLSEPAKRLAEMRGDNVSALPADRGATSMENIEAAAKDYGLSRFSGESDSLEGAADSYRSSKKRSD